MRIALGIEYDGSQYHGWQRQPNLHTVQGCLEQGLSKVADSKIEVQCAGRTDTGVHATGQVVHFDTEVKRPSRAWMFGVNSQVPKDICVRWVQFVDDEFHARFSAQSRRYQYIIYNNPIRPATFRSAVTWQYRPLDQQKMAEAGQHLIGEHDFTTFRAIQCQSSTPMRNLQHLKVSRHGNLIILDIQANAFLHHMIRNIAGVLMQVGSGKQSSAWVKEILEAKDRTLGAETAPAYGLYFVGVQYPVNYEINSAYKSPMFLGDL